MEMQTAIEQLQGAISKLALRASNETCGVQQKPPHYTCLTNVQKKLYKAACDSKRPQLASKEAAVEDKNVQQIIQELELLFTSKSEKCTIIEEKVGSYLTEYKQLEMRRLEQEENIHSLKNYDIHKSLETVTSEWNEREEQIRQELQALQFKYEEHIQHKRHIERSLEEKKEQKEKAEQDRIRMEQLQEEIKNTQVELERISQLCEQEQETLAGLEDHIAEKLVSLQNSEQSKVSENEGQEYFAENLHLQHICRELRSTILERKERKKEIIQKDPNLQNLLRTINQEVVQSSQHEHLIEMLEKRCSVLNILLQKVISQYALDGNLYAATIQLLLDNDGSMPLENLKEQLLSSQNCSVEEEKSRKRSQILQVIYTLVANSLVSINRSQANNPVSLTFSVDLS
ncbi:hypothetical protein Gasu2_02760 [Galdieria sulphuraria]|uniref:Uncharacterized protein n=1 Tax=Galdieria sulphuraria TaxID=130081 RepID=M2W152_GALSU|nr:uncharacterized protein Gasu_31850 [Galdieria sulphuraria]EME29356.1 hypothetical protein Gasu_31850 [Galdieria sulphuraria]GJD05827.1 hypothetical protein Gasu2_02760 [Galdieria sulphuraria]|eukprot:XP_005705876.1 hypothetical protein Gasu_31850 [Galdieria sulphuraria]